MNKLIFLTLLPLLVCCTVRERQMAEQKQYYFENKVFALRWQAQDSTFRYWHFQSDSPFYYHPDSGLYGWSGKLSVAHTQVQQQHGLGIYDSAGYRLDTNSSAHYTATPLHRRRTKRMVYAVLFLLAIGLYILWKKR